MGGLGWDKRVRGILSKEYDGIMLKERDKNMVLMEGL